MALLEIALFGGFKTTLPSGAVLSLPTKKAQALLAYLAVSPGQAHPRDKLATLLWSDMPKPQARASLRQAIFAIRKALHPDNPLEHEGGTLTLGRGAVEVDVERFERLAGEGTREALERAAGLYRGALLEGFVLREAPFEAWLVAERLRLQELGIGALTKLLALQRGSADLEAAVQTAHRLLAIDPPQESVHRVLMRLLVQLGRRGAALRQYQACVDTLTRDLGVEPDHQTKALYQEILASRPSSPLDEEIPRSAVSSRRRQSRSRPSHRAGSRPWWDARERWRCSRRCSTRRGPGRGSSSRSPARPASERAGWRTRCWRRRAGAAAWSWQDAVTRRSRSCRSARG